MVEIEVLGYKGRVSHVFSQQANPPWRKEDRLATWIEFDPSINGTLAIAVDLPVKEYSQEEFVQAVKEAAERELPRILEKARQERQELQERERTKAELEALAKRIESML